MNFAPVRKAFDRALEIWRGDLPAVDLQTTFRDATAAQAEKIRVDREISDLKAQVNSFANALTEGNSQAEEFQADYMRRAVELIEARQMGSAAPWLVAEAREHINTPGAGHKLREANPLLSQGAYGDIDLALQNVEWRREINLSWLEFSRWGILQIILISRLYYIKNPLIRRVIDIAAFYVFGRGVEVSSPDKDANQVLKSFFERNRSTLGQIALTHLERSKYTDGNLFFAFFPDKNIGEVNVRVIDATEIQDIVTDPDDADTPHYYRRMWTSRRFNETTGSYMNVTSEAWYPAIGFNPANKPDQIGEIDVKWDVPIHHRKCGYVGKWLFGCPLIYPALDWAREARRYLEACASVMQALNQIALKVTSKGGQQALFGIKQQMGTTVSVGSSLWDTNPPAVAGATWAAGPGTTLDAFRTSGAAQDPERVRQFKLMVMMVVGVPESFLSDISTGNLATATTLDRPTELVFLERQEAWREDLVIIAKYVLQVSGLAPKGKLRESLNRRAIIPEDITYTEVARILQKNGHWVYVEEAVRQRVTGPSEVQVKATFPSIREGDIPELIKAVVYAMTLGNSQGDIVGIDAKAGVSMMYELLGKDNGDELTEGQYPESEYDPNRTEQMNAQAKAALTAPVKPTLNPAPATSAPSKNGSPKKLTPEVKEAIGRLVAAVAATDSADSTN